MKIRYFSDIHLEFWPSPKELPFIGEDLVVLAGDIGVGKKGIVWAQRMFPDRPVVYVMGNHEFYGFDHGQLLAECRAMCAGSNVHLLENDSIDIGDFRVLGCTLWTDFLLFGEDRFDEGLGIARDYMSDYQWIRTGGFQIWPGFTADRCHESRQWLEDQLANSDRPVVVVSHHAPVIDTVNPRFLGQFSNVCFHNHWPEIFRPPMKLWIHGHHHWCDEKSVNGISVVTNQRGYPTEGGLPGFDWDRVVEVLP
jgi:hypothetical protein